MYTMLCVYYDYLVIIHAILYKCSYYAVLCDTVILRIPLRTYLKVPGYKYLINI